jgi:hypothetical protein
VDDLSTGGENRVSPQSVVVIILIIIIIITIIEQVVFCRSWSRGVGLRHPRRKEQMDEIHRPERADLPMQADQNEHAREGSDQSIHQPTNQSINQLIKSNQIKSNQLMTTMMRSAMPSAGETGGPAQASCSNTNDNHDDDGDNIRFVAVTRRYCYYYYYYYYHSSIRQARCRREEWASFCMPDLLNRNTLSQPLPSLSPCSSLLHLFSRAAAGVTSPCLAVPCHFWPVHHTGGGGRK